MEKYSLEVENWGSYELVKDFLSVELAKQHGISNFPQNEWRVFNRTSGSVVYQHDPFFDIAEEASQHLQRFADTEMWRQRFADRAAHEVVVRQQRSRLAEVAQRRFFGLVTDMSPTRNTTEEIRNHIQTQIDDEWDEDDRLDLARDKVNWQKEGF